MGIVDCGLTFTSRWGSLGHADEYRCENDHVALRGSDVDGPPGDRWELDGRRDTRRSARSLPPVRFGARHRSATPLPRLRGPGPRGAAELISTQVLMSARGGLLTAALASRPTLRAGLRQPTGGIGRPDDLLPPDPLGGLFYGT